MASKKKQKNRSASKITIESVLSSRYFILFGIMFLIVGIFYTITTGEVGDLLRSKFMSLFGASSDAQMVELPKIKMLTLIFLYFPPFVLLIAAIRYYKQYLRTGFVAAMVAVLYLMGLQLGMFISAYTGGAMYSNIAVMLGCMVASTIMLLVAVNKLRRPALLVASSLLFYFTVFVCISLYPVSRYLFPIILLFSLAVAYLSNVLKRPGINVINFLLAIGFFAFFFLRKLLANSKEEFLVEFFVFSSFYFIVYHIIAVGSSLGKEKQLSLFLQTFFALTNVLFYLGYTFLVMHKYYASGYMLVFVIVAIVVNSVSAYIVHKEQPTAILKPYYYVLIGLLALVLPLAFRQQMLFLFTVSCAVYILFYAHIAKSKVSMYFSFAMLTVGTAAYFYMWLEYLLSLMDVHTIPNNTLLWKGILTSVTMVLALMAIQWRLQHCSYSKSKEGFGAYAYRKSVLQLLHFCIYTCSIWVVYSVISMLTSSGLYSLISCSIAGSIYFIGAILYFAGKNSPLKKTVQYLSLVQVMIYPLLLGWSVTSEIILVAGVVNYAGLALHFIAILLIIILAYLSMPRIYKRNTKKKTISNAVQLIGLIYAGFLLCMEYNNLSLLLTFTSHMGEPNYLVSAKQMDLNMYLPYSILLWILSIVSYVYAFLNKLNFLKKSALVLFALVIIKVISFDMVMMEADTRSYLFIFLGVSLILFPVINKQMNKKILDERQMNKDSRF